MVTSARPIISAAAVAAVRCGLRIAFWRARPPETPSRANGRPSREASGRATLEAASPTPTNSASTPTASDRSRDPAAIPSAKRP
jgi:hypothetical protein